MAFHDKRRNNGYHSLFIKLFLTCLRGGRFFRTGCSSRWTVWCEIRLHLCPARDRYLQTLQTQAAA